MRASAASAIAAILVAAPPARAQYDAPTTRACGFGANGEPTVSALLPGPTPNDVAVYAFRSGATAEEGPYLGEGIAAGVASRLAAAGGLHVRSTAALHRAEPATREDVLAAGLQSGARHLVTGELRRTATGVRAEVRLYRSADGTLVATDRYEVAADNLTALEAKIALGVAQRVAPRLPAADQRVLGRMPTRNALAYDRFLLARSLSSDRTATSLARAVRVLDSVVALDPAFAEAHARRALAYADMVSRGWGVLGEPANRLVRAGLSAADRAITLDTGSVTAWIARGRLVALARPREPQRAWPAFERALALAPRNVEAWQAYGRARLDAGDFAEAEGRLLTAAALDPDRSAARVDFADLSFYRRDYAKACQALNAALRADPWDPFAYTLRALVRLHLSETRDAWGDAETTARLGRAVDGQAVMAVVDGHARDTASARRRIQPYVPPRGRVNTQPLSAWEGRLLALAALGGADTANAISFLERIRPVGAPLWTILQDPGFDQLRTDRRFTRLAQAARPRGVTGGIEAATRVVAASRQTKVDAKRARPRHVAASADRGGKP